VLLIARYNFIKAVISAITPMMVFKTISSIIIWAGVLKNSLNKIDKVNSYNYWLFSFYPCTPRSCVNREFEQTW